MRGATGNFFLIRPENSALELLARMRPEARGRQDESWKVKVNPEEGELTPVVSSMGDAR